MSPRRAVPAIDRFLSYVTWADHWFNDGVTNTRCLVWTGRTNRGYGRFRVSTNVQGMAHRWAYERWVGPIPEGLTIDHLCHNADADCVAGEACPHRACVNPSHLELTTQRENTLRGKAVTAKFAVATHCVNGHEFTPENTIQRKGGGRACRACRKQVDKRAYEKRSNGYKAGSGSRVPTKTHCKHGHPLSGDNLLITSYGIWRCRACQAATGARHSAAKKRKTLTD